MFDYRFCKRERFWLLGLRLIWQYRNRPGAAIRLVDRLLARTEAGPCGVELYGLLCALERFGADHLYLERFDKPGLTGDERDLLLALKACQLDDPLQAETALGALLPPGRTEPVLGALQAVVRHECAKATPIDTPARAPDNALAPAWH